MVLSTGDHFEYTENGVIHKPGIEKLFNTATFRKDFKVNIVSYSKGSDTFSFDMINLDCSFANAIRRIIIAEVPSVAIDRIYLHQNTSIMADEVLCHRIGLIPIEINPDKINFCQKPWPESDEDTNFFPENHVLFKINVNHVKNTGSTNEVHGKSIYSSDLRYHSILGQENTFSTSKPRPVSDEIILVKIAPMEEIKATCVAVKGIGRDHAKFEPVSVCYYKFLPKIELKRDFSGKEAEILKSSFAPGVISIDSLSGVARVQDARLDNGSREYMRHPSLAKGDVVVSVNPYHCLFTVESIAPAERPPHTLVDAAIEVMLAKCAHYLKVIDSEGFGTIVQSLKPDMGIKKEEASKQPGTQFLCGREVSLDVVYVSDTYNRATYRFKGEDHTLGAAIRYCILNLDCKPFCGYTVPHPLEDCILVDINSERKIARDLLRSGFEVLQSCFQTIQKEYRSAISIL